MKSPSDMSAELPKTRETFEAFCHKRWANSTGDLLDKREDGEYYNHRVQFAWSSWQEATRQAMEKCASLCDGKYELRAAQGFPREASTARSLADAIRALLPNEEKRHG